MKKLTAEKCSELLDSLNSNGMSILEGYYCEALEIALPILEQQEQGDGWIEWKGGECPVEDDVSVVEVKWPRGSTSEIIPGDCSWLHYGGHYDIIAYRIIPEQPTNQNGEQ